jgi:acetylornithine deacetylase
VPSLTVELLRELVAFDTTNPPRAIDGEGIFACAEAHLARAGFDLVRTDLGDGCVNLLAVRGAPDRLFNVHLDTVPPDAAWSGHPFELRIEDGRAIGLGACDVKGAAACLLAAAAGTRGPAAILLTSDEEAGSSRCVRTFLEEVPPFVEAVIVAEPTECRAVTAHRGLRTCEGRFTGEAAHGSLNGNGSRSAVHHAARWTEAALRSAESAGGGYDGLQGICLNVGVIEGGVKPNVVASSARVAFGIRPLPGQDGAELLQELWGLAPDGSCVEWMPRFAGPSLTPSGESSALVEQLGLERGPVVDFWTEAALFAEAGLPAIVLGPGSIRQAHGADEWVALGQLADATSIYERLLSA